MAPRTVLLFAALLGCKPDPSYIDAASVTATVSDTIASVVTVSWVAPEVDAVSVEYGPDTGYGHATPVRASAGPVHEVTVLGIPVVSTWHYRVVVEVDGERFVGEDHTVTTGSPAEDVREVETLLGPAGSVDGYALLGASGAGPPGDAVIRNPDGEVVWYWHAPDGQVFHPQRALDGSGILFNVDNQGDWDVRRVVRVSMDGTSVEETPTPMGHHDFVQVPGIRFAYIAAEVRDVGGEDVVGDAIVEILEDGSTREVWNAFDALDVRPHYGWEYPFYQEGRDWTHANGIAYDEADDAYYLSLYWLHQVVKIDRATGETRWVLGGDDGDLRLVDDAGFGPQHAPSIVDGDLVLFDNRGGFDEDSRLVRYTIDEAAGTATLVWSWSQAGLHAEVMGDALPLDDGTVVSAWGETGTVLVTDTAGEILWGLDHEAPTVLGQVGWLSTLYPE